MLGGDPVGLGDHLVLAGAQDDLTVVAPGDPGDVGGRHTVSCRSTSAAVACASLSEVVSRIAGEVGPCSAWPKRSVAHISASAVSSAMTRISVGPAKRSMPTRP